MKELILASGSPRRVELLQMLGVPFRAQAPQVDETRRQGEGPTAYVDRLARSKAGAQAAPDVVSLGADTVVVHEGKVLGKPAHPSEARSMLQRLSGGAHQVLTAVAVATFDQGDLEVASSVETAVVRMLPLTNAEIDGYLATGEPFDKAGAYALQGRGGVLVASIEGHPTTVVGLPLPATRRLLARAGINSLA